MKAIELKIGDKKSKREAVKVPLQVPENLAELNSRAKGSEAVVLRWAIRGYRIECQERSGARDAFKAGKTAEEIATIVNNYDPTAAVVRTRTPAAPKTITVPKGKKTFSAEEFKALLAQAGVQAVEAEA